jgi:hypothetical protein
MGVSIFGTPRCKKYVRTILAKVVVGKTTFCLGDYNNDLKDIFLVGPKVAGD